MLSIHNNQTKINNRWDHIQQPVHGVNQQADMLRLLAALDEGWQILEAANYLAHGTNAEDRGYLLTLFNPQRRLTRECNVKSSPSMDSLLHVQGVLTFPRD